MLQSLLLPAAVFNLLPPALALEWLGPRATPTASLPDAQGWTPKPTNGPQFDVVANSNPELKLFRRQALSKYPNTCGYVDGNGEYSFTCSGAYACAYNSAKFAFGCCSGTSTGSDGNVYFTDKCYVDTSTTGCYASTEANLCTGACTVSAAVCSQSSAPVCRTVLQFGTAATDPTTYTLYDCVPRGGKTRISLQNLFSLSSSVTPNPFIDPSYTLDGTTFVPIGGVVSKTGSSSSSTSNTVPGGNPTPVPDNGGGAGKTTTPKKKKTTGAIAGGVVGGLVAVGLIAGAVIWALIKKKQKARREAGAVQEVSHVTYVHDGK